MFQAEPRLHLAFVTVVDHGSVSAAARVLRLPRSTVSRQLGRLEETLGVSLLHRTTRRVTPTAAGERLYSSMAPLLQAFRDAEAATREEAGQAEGIVRVSVMPELASGLAGAACHLLSTHPGVRMHVISRVTLPDLRSGDIDVAVWPGEPSDPELRVRTLAGGHVGLLATPGYLRRHGTPRTVDDLDHHQLLAGHNSVGGPRSRWPRFDGTPVSITPAFVSNDALLLLNLTRSGAGICLLTDRSARDDIASGTLVRVLPEEIGRHATVRLVHAHHRPMPLRIRVVLDAITSHFVVPGRSDAHHAVRSARRFGWR